MEDIKNEVMEGTEKEVPEVKTKMSFKEKLAARRQAKKDDKIRALELKADLMKNPENPEERKAELKEIRVRQIKRAAVPVAIATGATVGTVLAVAKASRGNEETSSEDSVVKSDEE